jgi:hypothetical protein
MNVHINTALVLTVNQSISKIKVSNLFHFGLCLNAQILGGRHRMVVGFTTTYAISAYHH